MAGMFAQVAFDSGTARFVRVPSSALVVDAAGRRVVAVDDQNRVHFRKIVLGRDYGTESEVEQGIAATDRLVANPSEDLRDGQQVTVLGGGDK